MDEFADEVLKVYGEISQRTMDLVDAMERIEDLEYAGYDIKGIHTTLIEKGYIHEDDRGIPFHEILAEGIAYLEHKGLID